MPENQADCGCCFVGETETGALEIELCDEHRQHGYVYVNGEAWAKSER